MRISARNQLPATVRKITLGPVSAEVELELQGGGTLVAVVTRATVESLGLEEGKPAYAVVKATNVMVGIDH